MNKIEYGFQNSKESTTVFYKVNKQEDEQDFIERFKNSKCLKCYVNWPVSFQDPKIVCLNDREFIQAQTNELEKTYPINWESFKVFGVTGTNGKTTVVNLADQIAQKQKMKSLSIGTLGVFYEGEEKKNFSLTTPSYIDIWKTIFQFQENLDFVFMELSSHALVQNRLGDIRFDAIGWTSFSQDHLDYHKSIEEYFSAKKQCLNYLKKSGKLYVAQTNEKLKSVLKQNEIDFYELHEEKPESDFFIASYNHENFSLALGIIKQNFVLGLKEFNFLSAPAGRFNIIPYQSSYIVIDFAHTPDALENILIGLRNSFKNKNLVCLFGCGGNRDKRKRVLMGNIAEKHADEVIVTSDNPRFEEPMDIIKDIVNGRSFKIIEDRKDAIEWAIKNFTENSVILIAGKGHENYIDIKGEKKPYSDVDVVQGFISND